MEFEFAALTLASRLKSIQRCAAIGCLAPDRTTIVSEPRTAPSAGTTYFVFGASAVIWYQSPDQAWVIQSWPLVRSPMSSAVYFRSSGFCCFSELRVLL